MSVLIVPPLEEIPCPSLGGQVCGFIESNLVFGGGDLIGKPARLDKEKRALIWRIYEVFPMDHPQAGRRKWNRVCLSQQKGSAKTELAAWIAIVEADENGPVRFDHWDGRGNPVGRPIPDPFIPLMATSADHSEELVFGVARTILLESQIKDRYDIGLERIVRSSGKGKILPVTNSPRGNDGLRVTFAAFDETHRLVLVNQKKAHKTMLANMPKLTESDAWSLETTTMFSPGEGSIAEETYSYAQAVLDGRAKDSSLFFFHRQACDGTTCEEHDTPHDLSTPDGIRAAVVEAAGPQVEWKNIDRICKDFFDPTMDFAYLRRVWLNQPVRSHDRAFDPKHWSELARAGYVVPPGAIIALGFDGARHRDSTAIVGTEVATGYQWLVGVWEKPYEDEVAQRQWEVPVGLVDEAMAAAFARWNVWSLYADPPYWEDQVNEWCGRYGEDKVVKFQTKHWEKMAAACRAYDNAIKAGDISHDGSQAFARHVGNAHRMQLRSRNVHDEPMWVIQKERPDSPNKIDAAAAAVLSWQARGDAIASGVLAQPQGDMWDGTVMALGE